MHTSVTKRGQTVIPAAIRRRYHIKEGNSLMWLDDGNGIRVIPIGRDPIQALRGRGRSEGLAEKLRVARRADHTNE